MSSEEHFFPLQHVILIIGSFLTLIPNIPIINTILPIGTFNYTSIQGGVNFLESYFTRGGFQLNSQQVTGWTILSIPGQVLWIIYVAIGVILMLIAIVYRSKSFNYFAIAIIILGGLIDAIIALLIFIGDSANYGKYGLGGYSSSGLTIGLGYWLILIGSILILSAGWRILVNKNTRLSPLKYLTRKRE